MIVTQSQVRAVDNAISSSGVVVQEKIAPFKSGGGGDFGGGGASGSF